MFMMTFSTVMPDLIGHLLFLQRLCRIGTHEAEGLKGDGGEGHQQDDGQCGKVDDRGVPDTDRICLEPSADIGI